MVKPGVGQIWRYEKYNFEKIIEINERTIVVENEDGKSHLAWTKRAFIRHYTFVSQPEYMNSKLYKLLVGEEI